MLYTSFLKWKPSFWGENSTHTQRHVLVCKWAQNGKSLVSIVSKSLKIVFNIRVNYSSVQNVTSSLPQFSAWFIKTTYVNQVSCYFPIRTLEAQCSVSTECNTSARWKEKQFYISKQETGFLSVQIWLCSSWCEIFFLSFLIPFSFCLIVINFNRFVYFFSFLAYLLNSDKLLLIKCTNYRTNVSQDQDVWKEELYSNVVHSWSESKWNNHRSSGW